MVVWGTVTGILASMLPGNNGATTGILATGHVDFLPERKLLAGWRNISSNFRQRPKA